MNNSKWCLRAGSNVKTLHVFGRPQQRFLISPSLESGGLGRQLREQYGWIRLEERRDAGGFGSDMLSEEDASSSSSSSSSSLPSSSHIYMPGSGIAKRLYLQWYALCCGFASASSALGLAPASLACAIYSCGLAPEPACC